MYFVPVEAVLREPRRPAGMGEVWWGWGWGQAEQQSQPGKQQLKMELEAAVRGVGVRQ